ncbi:RagB/SusD family nutrient uptake outer membrane protein [Membranihabitans maritimus]|uniref:RagB/SusD family nutrient uptake outer membrane protein n=1 Tax=Membranihabitans maritimus TaxID=2904244 RepID=UPI001F24AE1B|nr:RagB/SusD family nutrient uptake outer membrane protein [Membranihabitans maritimus]
MKKYKIAILLFYLILTFSCENYLDKAPISQFNTGSFYENEEGVLLAVNGAYNLFKNPYINYLPQMAEARSDNHSTSYSVYNYTIVSRFNDDEVTNICWSAWQGYYRAITACNYVLDNIDNVEFTLGEERKIFAKGEVRFLRALAYFDLFRLFGGIPLVDKVSTPEEVRKTPRATDTEMYKFLIDELKQAANELPAAWEGNDIGRATLYAAKGILSRVYLTQKDWNSAKAELEDIINSGFFERFSNWEDIWDDANDNGKEFVFQIQFVSGNIGQGNSYSSEVIPPDISSDEVPFGGDNGYFYASQDIYDAFSDEDKRRDITVQKGYKTLTGDVNTSTVWVKKFVVGNATARFDFEINWPVLRISDVYLMYAEVLNELNYSSTGQALDILNWNRNRAGLVPLNSSEVSNQASFRLAIEKERRLEFAFENIRWFDLVRTNRVFEVVNSFLVAETYPDPNNYKVRDHQLLFAIPREVLNRNPDRDYMWQNPGY